MIDDHGTGYHLPSIVVSGAMIARRRNTHLGRYRQIASVLTRHGLGFLASVLGLDRFLPLHKALPRKMQRLPEGVGGTIRIQPHTRPERLRMALEELGTTFIKLGQILSTRADLLPPEYLAELAKLQDAAPSAPRETIHRLLESEFGRPVEQVFACFDPEPIASASIGQAHAATLLEGTEVIVKIRRPGVVNQVEEDLEILQNLAMAATRRWQFAQDYDLVGLAQEFAQTLRAELDYVREGRNAERFAANFKGDHTVHIPRIFWETSTSRVLTLERIRGIKISDLDALDEADINRKSLSRRAARVVLKMVFDDRFFHADPHPGNFFIEPGGRIGLIDFGMVGTLDQRTQEKLINLVLAVTSQDADRLVDAFLELGVTSHRVDRALLRQDLEHIVSRYYGMQLGDVEVATVVYDSLTVVRRHHLQLPSNLALLIKTMLMNEGLGVLLDPSFSLPTVLAPYAKSLLLREYSPVEWAKRLGQASFDAARLGVELPQQVRRIIGELERGELEMGVRPEGFEHVVNRLERIVNRIVLGILAAAFIVGLGILLAVYHPPGSESWFGVLFAVGFVAASGLGAYLAWSILQSGHD